MSSRTFIFAGGGTGGHIYPALAVAEQLRKLSPSAKVHFFCSSRPIDSRILSQTTFEYTVLPARGLSLHPKALPGFLRGFLSSARIASKAIAAAERPVVVGVGGFVAGPVCWAAHRAGIPVKLINVDIFPGRANRVIARWADEIFVQFEDTRESFATRSARVEVVGCPLRDGFENARPEGAIGRLGLDNGRRILLVTGASSGAAGINDAVCSLLEKLEAFAETWQVVHLTGHANLESVLSRYEGVRIPHKVLAYHDEMPDLLAAADLLIGRSGAVSVAEYAAAGVPTICMPYPHHKDRHQYFNAEKLVEAGAAVVVDDLPDTSERAGWLWEELEQLMRDDSRRAEMKANSASVARTDAAAAIARRLLMCGEQSQASRPTSEAT